MKKITIRLAFVLLAFLIPATASANDINIKPYAGGGLGGYLLGPGTGDKWVFGGYASVGVEVLPYLALEIRGGTTADGKQGNTQFGTDYFFSYLVKPQIKLNDSKINLYGLLGASTISSWYKATLASVEVTRTVTSFSFGGGIEFEVTDNLTIGAEGLIMDSQDKTNRTPYNGNYMASTVATVKILF